MESECSVPDCPITNDPENQIGELWGTSISFVASSEISQDGRIQRFATWEAQGVDQVKHDLLDGGHRIVGGPPAVRSLAWEWVRSKESAAVQLPAAKPAEMLTLRPGIWGVNIDLKEAGRRFAKWRRSWKL
jgi:hypothetical protein